jgi:hypothetical protein
VFVSVQCGEQTVSGMLGCVLLRIVSQLLLLFKKKTKEVSITFYCFMFVISLHYAFVVVLKMSCGSQTFGCTSKIDITASYFRILKQPVFTGIPFNFSTAEMAAEIDFT